MESKNIGEREEEKRKEKKKLQIVKTEEKK